MKIYLLPGLGADKRMYQRQLKVMPDAIALEHFTPIKGQSLSEYAKRFIPLIDTSEPFVLIGTSLGGMIALELSQHINPEKIILIASVKSREELPMFIRLMKYLKLHKIVPVDLYRKFNNIVAGVLDSRRNSGVAQLIQQMADDTSGDFLNWAIDAVINWEPTFKLRKDIIHIHGTNDRLFPISLIQNPVIIKDGSHVMNITMGTEVNKVLLSVLKKSA